LIVNIAGYRFVDLPDRDEIQGQLLDYCTESGLKGSILISPNGINFSLAGSSEAIDSFINHIEEDERFIGIPLKFSYTDYQPFRRMLVKKKKEIISLGIDEIKPANFTAPHVSPRELKRMLDDGEEVILVDTRNDYETRLGTFVGALDMKIPTFRDFPDALAKLPDSLRSKKIVTYCTGGIRCEKASVVMIKDGFENVMQLEGGILAYFEECGDSHWTGDCFVFDQRVALDHNLAETSYEVCFKCRQPLSMDEQKSENYQINQYCPYCRDSSPTATKSTNSHL
tara:strand:+ start:9065 stop:9913 length:849 start_codon:yes stop_codon:yes gene_type:complete